MSDAPPGWQSHASEPALRLAEIAADPAPVPERAQAMLDELQRHVPFDASWLAMAEPLTHFSRSA